jgi:hypothetical protein
MRTLNAFLAVAEAMRKYLFRTRLTARGKVDGIILRAPPRAPISIAVGGLCVLFETMIARLLNPKRK